MSNYSPSITFPPLLHIAVSLKAPLGFVVRTSFSSLNPVSQVVARKQEVGETLTATSKERQLKAVGAGVAHALAPPTQAAATATPIPLINQMR